MAPSECQLRAIKGGGNIVGACVLDTRIRRMSSIMARKRRWHGQQGVWLIEAVYSTACVSIEREAAIKVATARLNNVCRRFICISGSGYVMNKRSSWYENKRYHENMALRWNAAVAHGMAISCRI